MLESSLPVAAAALAAGQPDVARRLYLSLAERFEDAPEPHLGLGYIAFHSGDLAAAESRFLEAAARAGKKPAMRAEALLGAGRAALAQDRTDAAREHFRQGRESGPDNPSAPWLANGLAVAAAIENDYTTAETHYSEALRLSSGDPRVRANLVRTLVAAGRIEAAARAHGGRAASYWMDGDDRALRQLIRDAHRNRRGRNLASDTRALALSGTPLDPSCVWLESARGTDAGGSVESLAAPEAGLEADFALRLSSFGPPPASPTPAASVRTATATPNAAGLVLRLGDWSGPRAPLQVATCATSQSAPPVTGTPEGRHAGEVRDPSSPSAEGDATPHAPSEASATVDEVIGRSPPTTLTLRLGQSTTHRLERRATAVVVGAPEIADVQLSSPNMLHIIGRGTGRTTVSVLDGDWVEEQVVLVVIDLEPLRTVLAEEPGLDGVEARHLTRGVALSGEVASAEAAERALRLAAATLPEGVPIENELRIPTPQQVNLEVQIAEVHRSATEHLGINWEAFRVRGSEVFGFQIGRDFLDPETGSFELLNIDGEPASGFGFLRTTCPPPPGNVDCTQIGGMIDALATAGLANVLARPNVTAVSGETASFFSGGEFPLPVGFEDGVIIFEYKKYGVLLDFVPTVVDSGRIVLTVRPEVSEPSRNQAIPIEGVTIPVINVRRAETTVEVGDGESIVVAGLFRNASNTAESGIPVLKDVPLFGLMFGQTATRSDELELIVIVTARLVRADAPAEESGAPPVSRRVDGYHY